MIYLILVNLTLVLCYTLYSTFLKNLTFFQLNRLYLLAAVVVSLLIPIGLFIELPRTRMMEETLPAIDLNLLLEEELLLGEGKQSAISMRDLLQKVYWSGCFFALAWLCFRCIRVFTIIRSGKNSFSFAFFKKIVLGEKARDNHVIEDHEQIHASQGHSYDLVFVELVRVFNWFNPVFHYYLKELKFQHECIADAQCSIDRVAYAELLVSQAMQVEHTHFLHEFSKKSFLKNRIAMLFKDRSNRKYKFLYFSIMPVFGLTILSTLVFNSTNARSIVRDIEDKVESTTLASLKEGNFESFYEAVDTATAASNGVYLQEDSVYTHPQEKPKAIDNRSINVLIDEWANSSAAKGSRKQPVIFTFLVEKDGTVSRAFATTKEDGNKMELPAQQLTTSRWTPAKHEGKLVRSWATVYASFDSGKDDKLTAKAMLFESTSNYTEEQRDSVRAKAASKDEENKVFTAVEVNPEPVGGLATFRKWIGDNYQYPQGAIDAAVKGQIVVSFIVEADGALSNLKIIKDLGHGTGEAVLDVLQKAANWRPAIQNGRKVRVAYTLPVTLDLQAATKK